MFQMIKKMSIGSIGSNNENEGRKVFKSPFKRNSSQTSINKIPIHRRSSKKKSLSLYDDIYTFRKFMVRIEEFTREQKVSQREIYEWENQYFYSENYVQDTLAYLRFLEMKFQLPEDIFVGQAEIHANHRRIVADWLIQVSEHLDLEQDTLHLSVTYLDHFLMVRNVTSEKFQLLAIVCLLIACKYVERSYPEIKDLCYLTDNSYTEKEVITWERYVLNKLDFKIHMPDPVTFLDSLLRLCPEEGKQLSNLSRYLLDLTLCDHTYSHILPSMKAASSLCLAQKLIIAQNLGFIGGCWDKRLVFYSCYQQFQLVPAIKRLVKLLIKLPSSKVLKGAFNKYANDKVHGSISKMPILTNVDILNQIIDEKIEEAMDI